MKHKADGEKKGAENTETENKYEVFFKQSQKLAL